MITKGSAYLFGLSLGLSLGALAYMFFPQYTICILLLQLMLCWQAMQLDNDKIKELQGFSEDLKGQIVKVAEHIDKETKHDKE